MPCTKSSIYIGPMGQLRESFEHSNSFKGNKFSALFNVSTFRQAAINFVV